MIKKRCALVNTKCDMYGAALTPACRKAWSPIALLICSTPFTLFMLYLNE
jgi:hypothetical protein